MQRPLIIAGKTKACALLWQLDFAVMRPFDAALMPHTSIARRAIYSARSEINLPATRRDRSRRERSLSRYSPPARIARRGAAVQPRIEHGMGAGGLAVLHQRD